MMDRRIRTWSLCVDLLLVVAACVSNSDKPATRADGVRRTNEHWVQGEQLRTVMGRLAEQTQRLPRGLPEDVESPPATAKTFAEAAALADKLAMAAERIPQAVERVEMADADRKAFATQAQTLADQAGQFKRAAEARDVERMQNTLSAITSTCSSCHVRYRDFSGDVLWMKRAQGSGATANDVVAAGAPLRP